MKKIFVLVFSLCISIAALAQGNIQLRSTDRAECVKSDYTALKAVFSFSGLEAWEQSTERGAFSQISLPGTVTGGNVGDPEIPVINQLIAVPLGAHPRIEITNYSATDYRLEDYGIKTLMPRQPSLRKDQKPEDLPFRYNASAYQARGFRSEPMAVVDVVGTMRGVQLGKMTIEPVCYDPVNNTLRVFNDIEVEVHFDGADAAATEKLLIDTYSPYFDIVYKQLFNGRAVLDAYADHPDLYTTPVKMLVVTTSTYANSTAFQNWLTWKKQKGIYVDVQVVANNATSTTIKNLIYQKYASDAPTFLVLVGDESVVVNCDTYDFGSTYGICVTDMPYASVDGDTYHDMFMSRMPVSSTTELGNLVNKILTYEKYTMADPSYLNETLLIAGWDSYWTPRVGQPTIEYANNYYFNTAHGITPHVFITTASGQTSCYNYINNVGFVNYTAHGDIQKWHDPNFNNSNVNSLTNNDKYFWAMGNCCLTANWGNTSYTPCFGEAMVRAANKGAFGYIGSIPESYWFEDFYFGVGAFAATQSTNNNPTLSGTTKGCYDALFDESSFNTLNSVPYIGNVAVTYAHAANYTSSVSDEYYWRAYQCFGDGSVMPYIKEPAANTVSHEQVLPLGMTSFTVSADAGSYVAITVNNEIIGTAVVPSNGTIDVPISAQTTPGTAMIVVTRNQRQPYITTINIVGGAQYTINASAYPAAGGTIEGAGTYYESTTCTLTAIPNRGYEFTNWTKGSTVVSTNPVYSFTVSAGGTYKANFSALTLHNVSWGDIQHGTVGIDLTTAYKNEIVTLTPTPEEDYCFSSWDVRDANNQPITVTNNQFTMPDNDVVVNATFLPGKHITMASVMNGSISVSHTLALQGNVISLTATPNANYSFGSWLVYKTGDVNTLVNVSNNSFTMPNYDVTVSAVFNGHASETVSIGSGTGTTEGYWLPSNVWYKYSLSQQIYTAAELGYAGNITAVSFYYNGSTTEARSLEIYLSHTSSTSLSNWVSQSTNYKVFSGSVTFSSGWQTITLDTPFAYNGTSNLLLTVDDNTGAYSVSGNQYFYTYATDGTRAIAYYNDNTNPSPQSPSSVSGTTKNYNNQVRFTKVVDVSSECISLSDNALSGFTYSEFNGPSESQLVAVVAGNLEGNLTVTAPEAFEVSLNATGNYTSNLNITPSNGAVRKMLYIRMKADLAEGLYENQTLTFSSGAASTSIPLSGEVTNSNGYVSQSQTVAAGYGWVSYYVEFEGEDGLSLIEEAITAPGASIVSQHNGFATYDESFGWMGSLESINNEEMYQLNVPEGITFAFSGPEATPTNHPISIQPQWNWIGYPCKYDMDLSEALSGYEAQNNDIIKSHDIFSTYIEGYGWWGNLTTLHAGEGYMYKSNFDDESTLVYQVNRHQGTPRQNVSTEFNLWKPVSSAYLNNASIMVTVEGMALSEAVEIGAFVDGECRGSAKLSYVEPLGVHVAFLTVYGHENDELRFLIHNNGNTYVANEQVSYRDDMVVGTVSQPFVLHTGDAEVLSIFPNPVPQGAAYRIELADGTKVSKVEVFNALGAVVAEPKTPGLYTLKVTDDSGRVHLGRLVVR